MVSSGPRDNSTVVPGSSRKPGTTWRGFLARGFGGMVYVRCAIVSSLFGTAFGVDDGSSDNRGIIHNLQSRFRSTNQKCKVTRTILKTIMEI